MIRRLIFLLAGSIFCVVALAAPDIELGKRLYEQGLTADGKEVTAVTQGDIEFSSSQFSCANCHRRSGYGSSEGGQFVPPITASYLFNKREWHRSYLFDKMFKEEQPVSFWAKIRQPRVRPAFTRETLARAIREGVDPNGKPMDPLMPRFRIGKEDMDNLLAYLATLGTQVAPGVDDKVIHIATIVGDGVDPGKRDAMLATIEAFKDWMNLDTRGDLRNPRFSPHYRSDLIKGYRLWDIRVWRLHGDPASWPAQLDAYYREQPVFAVLSGMVQGAWTPIQRFCHQHEVPCLFPITDQPAPRPDYYTFYLTRGLRLEADALAESLKEQLQGGETIVQLHAASGAGQVPAQAFRAALGDQKVSLQDRAFSDEDGLKKQLEALVARKKQPDYLVIWPGRHGGEVVDWLLAHPAIAGEIYLPSSIAAALPEKLPPALEERLYVTWPYEYPGAYHPRAFRVRAWLRSRGLDIPYPRIQFDTYYALTILQYGLAHIVDHFSRDYLIEYIEHEAENALNPGTYPRLSLGPGQRFASRGAYIMRRNSLDRYPLTRASEWIVPDSGD